MARVFASAALLPTGWARDVAIEIEADRIVAVTPGADSALADERHAAIVPAIANLHSHAFQRAMSGLAERRGAGDDSFWSWRSVMYKFALSMTPDDVQAVAAQLYVEMLEAGFARVGEFHYLHHDETGAPYANIAEMAERIAAASVETGIGLSLLPVFYAHGGFGALPPTEGQRRFITNPDSYARLVEASRAIIARTPGANIGIAPHSLRAATLAEIATILPLAQGGPVHIHVAEQTLEVDDCLAANGARPVQLLLDNAPVDGHWCLIHATHLTQAEIADIAQAGAVVGLCPITEANLGDGIFPASEFLQHQGRFGVGSDSNVRVSLSGELSQLEYSQRLGQRARNVIAAKGASTGQTLFEHAALGGAAALGVDTGIAAGMAADLVALDTREVEYLPVESQLDAWIFGHGVRVSAVWARGHKQVSNGRHLQGDAIRQRFENTMQRLLRA
jgi:formiminoglutamate deiminase